MNEWDDWSCGVAACVGRDTWEREGKRRLEGVYDNGLDVSSFIV